jgi:geranylgeranyl diphosphate synthase type I
VYNQSITRYAQDLDASMRRHVATIEPPDLRIMLEYALGWVDEHNRAYTGTTGKRIRPAVLLMCCEAAGGDWQQALGAAAAVEFLHNFSLIHDDIQDDSPLRHGRPTVWQVWGLANAINAGDLLFSLAFVALQSLAKADVPDDVLIQIWAIFNHTNLELTRGQHLDMQFEGRDLISVDEYLSMIEGKSAALLSSCAAIGALIASGNPQIATQYGEFALNLGLAFQVRDDILGIWGDAEVTGKSTATDIVSKKKSLPILYALERSSTLAEIYRQDHLTAQDVEDVVEILSRLEAQQYAVNIEAEYSQQALRALDDAQPQAEAAEHLRQFVDQLFRRSY